MRLSRCLHSVYITDSSGDAHFTSKAKTLRFIREKMSQIEKKVSRFDLLCRETLQRLYGPLTRRTYSLVILEQSLLLGSLL